MSDFRLKRESLSDIRLRASTRLNVEFIRFRKNNAGFKISICGILVLFVFHNLKFCFKYKKYYCIYLHFNSRLSKIRHSIMSKIRLESNRIILHITDIEILGDWTSSKVKLLDTSVNHFELRMAHSLRRHQRM